MTDSGQPDGRTAELATEAANTVASKAFLHDAVETLDLEVIRGFDDIDHAVEQLGLRGHYWDNSPSVVIRRLSDRQAQLEAQGFASIQDGIDDRASELLEGLELADRELLEAYVTNGSPALEDESAMDELAGSFGMETTQLRLQLRKSVRRLAVALGTADQDVAAEVRGNRERGTIGNSEVAAALEHFANQDKGFLEDPPEAGDARWAAFDEHKRRLAVLRETLRQAGVSERDERIFDRFYGLQKDGREEVADIARAHEMTAQEVHAVISDVSNRLGEAGWLLKRY